MGTKRDTQLEKSHPSDASYLIAHSECIFMRIYSPNQQQTTAKINFTSPASQGKNGNRQICQAIKNIRNVGNGIGIERGVSGNDDTRLLTPQNTRKSKQAQLRVKKNQMMRDTVTRLGSSDVQHGSFNDRVYLMDLAPEDTNMIIPAMEGMAKKYHYSKLFARVPDSAKDQFCAAGYRVEAHIPDMYRGREDGWFLARYPEPSRADPDDPLLITADVLKTAKLRSDASRNTKANAITAPGFVIEETGSEDADALAELYTDVFESYPFPIYNPDFLRETMDDGDRYFVVRKGDRVVAVSSAEVDASGKNAEMSVATHPDYQGRGLCPALLTKMEKAMRRSGILTAYAIARAAFYPVNITFARAGYRFGGTLINDTQICGGLESMNVWHKSLSKENTLSRG